MRGCGVVGGLYATRADGHAPLFLPTTALPGGFDGSPALGLPGVAPCGDGAAAGGRVSWFVRRDTTRTSRHLGPGGLAGGAVGSPCRFPYLAGGQEGSWGLS